VYTAPFLHVNYSMPKLMLNQQWFLKTNINFKLVSLIVWSLNSSTAFQETQPSDRYPLDVLGISYIQEMTYRYL
jgi:hypothetical protein